jgi:hypothetical protein
VYTEWTAISDFDRSRVAPVPIIAVCPYCEQGKVSAPSRAIGMSIPCPRCKSYFTIMPPERPGTAAPATRTTAVAAAETATHSPATPSAMRKAKSPGPTTQSQPEVETSEAPEPDPDPPVSFASVVRPSAEPTGYDPGIPWAMVAFIVTGVGLVASQFPYGRFVTAGLGGVGLLLGLIGLLAAERRREIPLAAAGLGLLAALVAVFLPGMIGMGPWLPVRVEDNTKQVKIVGFNGQAPVESPVEWVDVTLAAWQLDDVRVSVQGAAVGPIELAGPDGAKKMTREKVLQITLVVSNVGVARQFEFKGLAAGPQDPLAPIVTEADGRPLAARRFDPGWVTTAKPGKPLLVPGGFSEYLLAFDSPAKPGGALRLEIPAAAFGVAAPVRLELPAKFVVWAQDPRDPRGRSAP